MKLNKEDFRVYLRALELDDYKTSTKWRNDDEIWDNLVGRKYFVSKEYEKKWVEDAIHNNSKDIKLAVCLKENDKLIGYIYLIDIDWFNRKANASILIGEKDCWGNGFGTESIILLIHHAFYNLGMQRISARQLLDNKASIKAFHKCGFNDEGILRKAVYKDGEYRDLNLMSIIRSDFDSLLEDRNSI